ncbi:MAG: Gfo/Idh/MocA family oxidoreductase [Armatimonadota bacterium]|jgi:predicted dehydrogenase|nr:Gfo/Idh/MocA family oxidoreductase [Armatimonadota bacterium]
MVNWGVIGCGGIADRRTIPGMMGAKNARLLAVMDQVPEVTQRVKEKYACPRAYATVEELLGDPDVQAVYIATPVFVHRDQVIAAATAGKHILVEKPLAMNVAQGREMIEACRQAGVYATEGYMMKFHSLHQKAKEIVASGALGKVVLARAQLSCWYPPIEGAWRQDPALGGGGALMDMATHLYDLLRWLVGDIREVTALADNLVHGYPVDDASSTLLRFDGGAHGFVDAFFCVPDSSVLSRLEIYGSRGSILAEGTIGQGSGGTMVAYVEENVRGYDAQQAREQAAVSPRPVTAPEVNPYTAEIEYLSQCIEERRPPTMNTLEEGLRTLSIAEAAYRSARTGQRERL